MIEYLPHMIIPSRRRPPEDASPLACPAAGAAVGRRIAHRTQCYADRRATGSRSTGAQSDRRAGFPSIFRREPRQSVRTFSFAQVGPRRMESRPGGEYRAYTTAHQC